MLHQPNTGNDGDKPVARHQVITADALRQTLAYVETVCASRDFHLFHGIEDRRVDFRLVAAKLIDAGAPIADWRNDPRVFVPTNFYRVRPTDMFGNLRGDWAGDVYAGEEAEALHGIRREYEKRLIDWLMADVTPVPRGSDEANVALWLIHHMPTVEQFIDADPALEVAA